MSFNSMSNSSTEKTPTETKNPTDKSVVAPVAGAETKPEAASTADKK